MPFNLFKYILALGCSLFILSCQQSLQNGKPYFNVKNYGAVGDSLTLDKAAIQKAIDAAYNNGGGTVLLPAPGKYRTGTIWLKSNVVLEIEGGATIYGSKNLADYDSVRWGHNEDRCPYHLILAQNAHNVTIQGQGTIDGLGHYWYDYTPKKPRWMKKHTPRPSPMVEFDNCTDIKVKDVLLTNAAGWTMHTFNSNQIHINGIRLINNLYGPNNDGIDVTGCQNVMISDCYVRTCDDAVCIKTTTDSKTTHNVTVTNCTMQTTCVALKFGETSKDISDVTFSNCVITKSSRAFGIYATWGGNIQNVVVDNIICNTNAPLVLNRPFQISAMHKLNPDGSIKNRGGNVKNVIVSNFIANTEGRILINASPDLSIENVTLRDIKLNYPYIENPELYAPFATSNQFKGIDSVAMNAKAAIVVTNASNLTLDGLKVNWPSGHSVPKAWQHPERIENGKFDKVHKPDYQNHQNVPFSAFFASNVQGGYIFAPMATGSQSDVEPFRLIKSNINLFESK